MAGLPSTHSVAAADVATSLASCGFCRLWGSLQLSWSACNLMKCALPPASQAYRFATTLWPFEIVHAVLWRASHPLEPGGPQLLRGASAQSLPDAGTDAGVPMLCRPPAGTSWWQRLRLAYVASPTTAGGLGRLASARRLLRSARQDVSGQQVGALLLPLLTHPAKRTCTAAPDVRTCAR